MNISYNWLKKYIAADLSAEAMATILTDIGLEVESFEKIETVRGGLQGVVVGEVLTCEKHPDSDHLHVTTVDVGAPEPLRIVCGAPNEATRRSRSSAARSAAWSRSECSAPRTSWGSARRTTVSWSCPPMHRSGCRPRSICISRTTT